MTRNNKSLSSQSSPADHPQTPLPLPALMLPDRRHTAIEWGRLAILLLLGIYLSIVFFGHQQVPNSDFPAFVGVGHDILHCQAPSSYKRVPLLGIMQIALSQLFPNSFCPTLTGALVLNGLLYTASILILYRIALTFLSVTSAGFLAVIAALNPYSLAMLVQPIAEIPLVFFIMLTLHAILKGSRWCYLWGSLGSMVRYECFLLIILAFILDMIGRQPVQRRLITLGLAALAATPMILWMIGTKLHGQEEGGSYFRVFLNVEKRNGFDYFKMLWQTAFFPLTQTTDWARAMVIQPPASRSQAGLIQSHQHTLQILIAIVTAVLMLLGLTFTLVKKQWRFLALAGFWCGYCFVHSMQSVLLDRYTMPVIWVSLLLAACGGMELFGWIGKRLPTPFHAILLWMGAFVALFWAGSLWPAAAVTGKISPASSTAFYAGLLTVSCLAALDRQLLLRSTLAFRPAALLLIALPIISNQPALAIRMGDGKTDIEFRHLAEWFDRHAAPDEKLVTSLSNVVTLFIPGQKSRVFHTESVGGDDLLGFARDCKARRIAWIAWDSRLGFSTNDYYFKAWKLARLNPLAAGKSVGPFQFQTRLAGNSDRRYLLLYKLDFDQVP